MGFRVLALGLLGSWVTGACSGPAGEGEPQPAAHANWIHVPVDFPAIPTPEDNPLTIEKAELGRTLFFDPRLSRTMDISCASCHEQRAGFSDERRVSLGVEDRVGTRNAPTLTNTAWNTSYFWDGGVPTLEIQVVAPILNPVEMDMSLGEVVERLAGDAAIDSAFFSAFGQGPSDFTVPRALASFVRSLISGDSPYDGYQRGDRSALTPSAQRGLAIFMGERGECFHCHVGFNFSNNGFRNNGTRPDDPDLGRAILTHRQLDEGKFRVPTLRNVAVTAPYMHDGSLATLRDVIDHYDLGGGAHPNRDVVLKPLSLTEDEKADLLAFLHALTDEAFLNNRNFSPAP